MIFSCTRAAVLCLVVLNLLAPRSADANMTITSDMQFSYADKLYADKDYETAQVEFKRFLHFFTQDARRSQVEFKTAMSLFYLGRYNDAAKGFNQIILKDRDDEFTRESYFYQSRAFMEMGNWGYAQLVLQNYLKLAEDEETRDRIYFHLSRIYIQESTRLGTDSLGQAEKYLKKISSPNQDLYWTKKQMAALEQAQTFNQKNPVFAGLLAIIPGGGFLYCERYKDAFITFALNAGLMVAAYESFKNEHYALGGVVTFVGTGFYAGNIYGSMSAAHKYNKARQIEILNREFRIGTGLDFKNNSYLFSLNYSF